MAVYGISGSGTYAVALQGVDDLMRILPNNSVNEITAQDMRNVAYTLWEIGGGGGGSFSYTQTAPLTQGSVNAVGGIPAGSTFDNVPLQTLFDRMFFPAQGTVYSISASPASFELGYPNNGNNPVTTITVNITKKTPDIQTAGVTSPGISFGTVRIPTTYDESLSTQFSNVNVVQDTTTTYTLNLNDGTARSDDTSVTWYFPGFFGSINLSSNGTFTPVGSFVFGDGTTSAQRSAVRTILKGVDPLNEWKPVWQSSGVTNFTKITTASPTSTGDIGSLGHKVLIIPKSWYGGDGKPSGFTDNNIPATPYYLLFENESVKNQYGASFLCNIYITFGQGAGSGKWGIVP
jgi:hypothetical protein